jgi:3-oxoacyl-(acyl-carrier-protein) synthase
MNTVVIQGAGWIHATGWGGVLQSRQGSPDDGSGIPPWKDPGLFPVPVKNIARFDAAARLTLCACALAMRDAGWTLGDGAKRDVGLLGTNAEGCLRANQAYFQDYLTGGRVLARANLFVYTLPSSPLAEAAIHFGLQGPMVYIGYPGGGLADLLGTASLMIAGGEAGGMLTVRADEREAVAFILAPGQAGGGSLSVADLVKGLPAAAGNREWIARLEQMMKGCGGV